ncbi:MAG: amidohydrolase family protein [bacterium]
MQVYQRLVVIIFLILSSTGISQNLLLKNVRIVDPASQKITTGSMIIRDGTIAEIVPKAPVSFDGETIDLSGKWLIPGLNDMHTHSYGNAAPGEKVQMLFTAGVAKTMLYCGVTGFLDLFSAEDFILSLRDRQRKDGLQGADIYCAGPCFTCDSGHCTEYGVPTRTINTPEEARTQVAELAQKKPDVIKLVYDHNSRMPTVTKETMEALVAAANEHGLKTVIHFGTWQDAEEAVLAGATALTHTNFEAIPDDLVKLMKEKNIYLIPTLTVHTGMLKITETPAELENALLQHVTTPELRAGYQDSSAFNDRTKRWLKRQKSAFSTRLQSIKKLAGAGIKIMTGTDAGNIGTFQGYSVHSEMALLVEAGLSPWQALIASTRTPGDFWGKKFGVNPGDEANLLVLEASPIEDIRNTEKIAMVIHHGRIINREALLGSN